VNPSPLTLRRKALGLTVKELAGAAHIGKEALSRPGPHEAARIDAVLCMLEAGLSLKAATATLMPAEQRPIRPPTPPWPCPTVDPNEQFEGQCFAAGPDGDPDPGDGGALRGVSRAATVATGASSLGWVA
jgi:hypothetical protein